MGHPRFEAPMGPDDLPSSTVPSTATEYCAESIGNGLP